MGGFVPKSKLIDTIKSTIGYDNGMGFVRESKDAWPNDNPFTTTSTVATPLTTEGEKVTQTQTAMLEVFQWLSSTFKPIVSSMSTPSTGSYIDKDEWVNSVETYRVDEPPHSPGLSECRFESSCFILRIALLFCGLSDVCFVFVLDYVF